MPICNKCEKSKGLLELKNGVCKSCLKSLEIAQPDDKSVNVMLSTTELLYGYELSYVDMIVVADLCDLSSLRSINPLLIARSIKVTLAGTNGEYSGKLGLGALNSIQKLKESASALGANAVVGVRVESAIYSSDSVEIIIYGTAVKAEKKVDPP